MFKKNWIDNTKHFKLLKLGDKILLFLVAIILIISIPFFVIDYKNKNPDNSEYFKCSESYNTDIERANSISAWVKEEKKNNPDITLYELYSNRYDFLIKNRCIESLKSLYDGVGATKELIINWEINELNNGSSNTVSL